LRLHGGFEKLNPVLIRLCEEHTTQIVDSPKSNDAINDQGQRLMIRGERESPGSLQTIASFKHAASSRVAHLGDHENVSVQQV
jgi:hypothetical protein